MTTVGELLAAIPQSTDKPTAYVATMADSTDTDRDIRVTNISGQTLAADDQVLILRVEQAHFVLGILP